MKLHWFLVQIVSLQMEEAVQEAPRGDRLCDSGQTIV